MEKYICTVCDYVYDPELGDPENGIPAGNIVRRPSRRLGLPLMRSRNKEEFEKAS